MGFMKGVSRGSGPAPFGGPIPAFRAPAAAQRGPLAAPLTAPRGFAWGQTLAGNSGPSSADPTINQFVQRWGLDTGSVRLLEDLTPEARRTVISEFDPRGDTRNVHGKLRAFAMTIGNGSK